MQGDERVGVVVAGHGVFASGALSACEVIIGAPEAVVALDLAAHEDPAGFGARMAEAVASVDHGAGVLVATDLPGATPFNAAVRLTRGGTPVEVVAGVNLPMLLETLLSRDGAALADVAGTARSAGRNGVVRWEPNG
ncbi:PTS system N-acetylgalactosamine-specific IIA component/PTS system mannose-specific IIA component [Murinocardiopsis flavida]|uniref:PTS system N-acetylgalactosamine-specific IIA component/PTS system mannose-specific IIA component n=1 Tax=Murinocardiopsis flavida TaxID=645275 RepID=A0A2P8DU19_9ACTN|nr:PTS sugar transporter subunit IIA [Murinocardiopsis flavida]PSL00684.1 PTS system N-acetylgalactosamine-specific IIA component/PTS system mannose-specific IIA component [Murinocardiopsis flavida]